MRVLGISGLYHDSAAALIEDGRILAAAQEERFTRKRHDASFPIESIKYCLEASGLKLSDLDSIAFYDKPLLKFERLLETYLAFAPRGFRSFRTSMPVWIKEKLLQKTIIAKDLIELGGVDVTDRLLFAEHHQSHAASAFFPSPFEEAIVLTMDGVGEWTTTSAAIGRGNKLEVTKEIRFPHSIGLLYSAFTYYTGFKVNSGEYKVMGLAPYGEPIYKDLILEKLVNLKEDGSFRLDMRYFDYCTGLKMTNAKFDSLFGGPARQASEPLTEKHMNLAASVQAVTEEIVLRLARSLGKEYGIPNLCLAGGVALNCVANGKILRDGCFENVWVQPAAGDAGGALGAALSAYYMHHSQPRVVEKNLDSMKGGYLGPRFEQSDVERRLQEMGAKFSTLSSQDLVSKTAEALEAGQAVGWFQGRMEFGPRALGARSIIGDARSDVMQRDLNLKVKFRESFRPFAPSVLSEDVSDWFEFEGASPYMLMVAGVQPKHRREMTCEQNALFGIEKLNVPRSVIPAVTHVDYSARLQTVHEETNPRYHALLSEFKRRTGTPVLVNTSFNVRGEPIVCTPEDAFKCFMGTNIEVLVVENCFLRKSDQDPSLKSRYEQSFELD